AFVHRGVAPDVPIGFDSGDANFYRYAHNNPTNRVDASGRIGLALSAQLFPQFLRPVVLNATEPSEPKKKAGELLNPQLKGNEDKGLEVFRQKDEAGNYFKISNNFPRFLGLIVFDGRKIPFGACERGAGMNCFLVTYDAKGKFAAIRWYNFETISPMKVKQELDRVRGMAETQPELDAKGLRTWFYKNALMLKKVDGSYLTIYQWGVGNRVEQFELRSTTKSEEKAYEQVKHKE